jgi:hypothetical protein
LAGGLKLTLRCLTFAALCSFAILCGTTKNVAKSCSLTQDFASNTHANAQRRPEAVERAGIAWMRWETIVIRWEKSSAENRKEIELDALKK